MRIDIVLFLTLVVYRSMKAYVCNKALYDWESWTKGKKTKIYRYLLRNGVTEVCRRLMERQKFKGRSLPKSRRKKQRMEKFTTKKYKVLFQGICVWWKEYRREWEQGKNTLAVPTVADRARCYFRSYVDMKRKIRCVGGDVLFEFTPVFSRTHR